MTFRKPPVQGARRFKKFLRALTPAIRDEVRGEMQSAGAAILAFSRSQTPVKTGALRAALSYKVAPKTLNLRVGLIGKPTNRRIFYAQILEFGRKAQTVKAARATSNGITRYLYRVSAISAGRYDIVRGRVFNFARNLMRPISERAYGRALSKLAGVTDDG